MLLSSLATNGTDPTSGFEWDPVDPLLQPQLFIHRHNRPPLFGPIGGDQNPSIELIRDQPQKAGFVLVGFF
jgi:hypothetical protein